MELVFKFVIYLKIKITQLHEPCVSVGFSLATIFSTSASVYYTFQFIKSLIS
jgi:hypothetical protein